MPKASVNGFILLPNLKLLKYERKRKSRIRRLLCEKTTDYEVCPHCVTKATCVYDRRSCTIKDEPIRDAHIWLVIRKRRFRCPACKKVFTEPIAGIKVGRRTTERYKRSVFKACTRFRSLSDVRKIYRCSGSYAYKAYFEELAKRQRGRIAPWPHTIGIDEHFFRKGPHRERQFVTSIVDYKRKKVQELVESRNSDVLTAALEYIPGRGEGVKQVVMDLSRPYRSFVTSFFPNAEIVADKFHVLRLLNNPINRQRKHITGDKRSLPVRRLLLADSKRLDPLKRNLLYRWVRQYPELHELYQAKEALHRFYRIKGQKRARRAFIKLTDALALCGLSELHTLRKTLMKWRTEILNYFKTRLTNGRTEGFNNKIKVIKKNAYGYRSFKNYRLVILNACS